MLVRKTATVAVAEGVHLKGWSLKIDLERGDGSIMLERNGVLVFADERGFQVHRGDDVRHAPTLKEALREASR